MRVFLLVTAVLVSALFTPVPWAWAGDYQGTSCETCHAALSGRLSEPVLLFREGVHRVAGVGCQSCHGGDPRALSVQSGHTGLSISSPLEGMSVISLCGSCHSNPRSTGLYGGRVDQEVLYRAGRHGEALMAGGSSPTCVTCHGSHGILPPDDPDSPVATLNIPSLCSGCHGASGWEPSPDGVSSPSWIFEDYRTGLHGRSLLDDLNLKAPTCVACHGVHGTMAAGPGETPRICGSCHREEARYFNAGPHRKALDVIGRPGCTGCHEAHLLKSFLSPVISQRTLGACADCHSVESKALAVGRSIVREMEDTTLSIDSLKRLREDVFLRGLDTLKVDLLIQEADSWFSQTLPAFHALSEERTRELAGMALDKAHAAEGLLRALSMELSLRRAGLLAISLLCLITIGLLAVKLNLLERMKKDRVLNDLKESAENQRGPTA